jgi:SAM-dependent methyltransferase
MTAPSPSTNSYSHPDEQRMAAFRRVYENCLVVEDIYPTLARRFEAAGVRTFAELGGGRGPISTILDAAGIRTCVVDRDEQMLAEAHRPAIRGDIEALPLADSSVDGAAAVNCLYFVEDPRTALREARRVLRPGGLFVASAPGRGNDPELQAVDPNWGRPSSFDAEDAPALVAEIFGEIEVHEWSVPAYFLPDRQAIADYLHAFNIPDWERKARALTPPLTITKVGAEVWARR